MGKYLAGAYFNLIQEYDFVDYGVRIPGGRMSGLYELGWVRIHFGTNTALLGEAATHISDLDYIGNRQTIENLRQK